MTRVLLSIIAFLVAPVWAQAASVPVKSGSHNGFDRLVVHLPQRLDWQSEDNGAARKIIFDADTLDFDVSAVFGRIERTRISDVRALDRPAALEISLACQCRTEIFWVGSSMLVVDVYDAAGDRSVPTAFAETPRPETASSGVVSNIKPSYEKRKDRPVLPVLGKRAVSAGDIVAAGLRQELGLRRGTLRQALAGEGPASSPSNVTDLSEFREDLAERVGWAASHGVLNIAEPGAESPPEPPVTPLVETGLHADAMPEGDATEPDAPDRQIRFYDSLDLAEPSELGGEILTQDGVRCLSATEISVEDWGGSGSFSAQVGPLRRTLSAEKDLWTTEQVLHLARLYVFFSFGAEARQALHLLDRDDPQRQLVQDLSWIMDLGHVPYQTALKQQLDCDGPVALWAALSHEPLPKGAAMNVDAMLFAFSALPKHLRDYLGPLLARKFVAAGRNDTAERLLTLLGRDGAPPSPIERMAVAEIHAANGDDPEADAELAEVAQGNSILAAEALLARIERQISKGEGISEDMAALAGAYAVEFRGHPIEPDLLSAQVEALAAAGDFDQAFSEFKRIAPELEGSAQSALVSRLYGLLTDHAEDVTFLKYGFLASVDRSHRVDAETGNGLAERLLDLGFADAAAPFLDGFVQGPAQPARKLLRARIALAQNKPRTAEAELLGLSGPEANILRAQARSMSGQHKAAEVLFQSAGEDRQAAREAARIGDWQALVAKPQSDMSEMARLLVAGDEDRRDIFGDRPLSEARDLLGSSAQSRAEVDRLLSNRIVPDS